MRHNATSAEDITGQYRTGQYSTGQYSTGQYRTGQYAAYSRETTTELTGAYLLVFRPLYFAARNGKTSAQQIAADFCIRLKLLANQAHSRSL